MTSTFSQPRPSSFTIAALFLLAALWSFAIRQEPMLAGPAFTWVFYAWATGLCWRGLFKEVLAWRRVELALGVLFALSPWLMDRWGLRTAHGEAFRHGASADHGLLHWSQLIQQDLAGLLQGAWLHGWQALSPGLLIPLSVALALVMIFHSMHAWLPASVRRLAGVGALAWMVVLAMSMGAVMSSTDPFKWGWLIATVVVAGVAMMTGQWMAVLLFGVSLCASLSLLADWLWSAGAVLDVAFSMGLFSTVVTLLVWGWRLDTIRLMQHLEKGAAALRAIEQGECLNLDEDDQVAPVDEAGQRTRRDLYLRDADGQLIDRLDSAEAQEGADKYTRE